MKTRLSAIAAIGLSLFASSRAQAVDNTISITSIANANFVGILPGFPSGTATLGGVTFDLPPTRPSWDSVNNASDSSATLTLNIAFASSVNLLLNTGNTYTSQMSVGNQIGSVVLSFSSGSPMTIPLDVGVNIREWGITAPSVINTTSDSNVQEVWRGANNSGDTSVVDMLTIPLSGTRTLTSIQLLDQSQADIGQSNPTVIFRGATVQSVPEPTATIFLLSGGIGFCAGTRRRKRSVMNGA